MLSIIDRKICNEMVFSLKQSEQFLNLLVVVVSAYHNLPPCISTLSSNMLMYHVVLPIIANLLYYPACLVCLLYLLFVSLPFFIIIARRFF